MATNKRNSEATEEKITSTVPQKDLEAENAALKAELEALKAEAAAKATASATPEVPVKTGPKMVKVKIPKSKEQKEDVFVSVNFHTYQIQRGVEVEVPDFVFEVLKHQEEMLEQIVLFEERLQSKK